LPRKSLLACIAALAVATAAPGRPSAAADEWPNVSTFSIVGFDPYNGDLGVAVQSRFLGVGPVVPFAKAGVGAVATQAFANTTYGPRGLELLASGKSPDEVIKELTTPDAGRDRRQVGLIDAKGRAASFTGSATNEWAGHRVGPNYAAQGNILAGPQVVEAMGKAFEGTDGDLAEKLVAALEAGQAAGGDTRGKQSAALLVVRDKGGYGGFSDRYIDIRVDDAEDPFKELRRLLGLWDQTFLRRYGTRPISVTAGNDVRELQGYLKILGFYPGEPTGLFDEATGDAIAAYRKSRSIEGGGPFARGANVELLKRIRKEAREKQGQSGM
jgi:uncharacterized Ntn-hydrolase superfamily protein